MKLSDASVRTAKANGKVQKLSDGGGLYLHITAKGSKLWRMAYRFEGKQKLLSFGAYPAVSLKDARQRRDAARELLAKGIDPGDEKKQAREAKLAQEREERDTFEHVAREWFSKHSPTLSEKHAQKLQRYLENILFPAIGAKPVTQLEPADFLWVVEPSERLGHNETAHKLMRLCGQVTRYARITGRVKYDVAAGLTEALTPVKRTHFAAVILPDDIGQLLRDIDAYVGYTSVVYCLKILPHVFTRPSELRLAHWNEFDFKKATWVIPASRMKMRREHVVPLSRQVLALLNDLYAFTGNGDLVFPSARARVAPISDAAPLAALRRMGYGKDTMTLHGFRAMASTRLNELGFRSDVIEAQLAHKEPDTVRLAYNRAEYMEERRQLMQRWSDYLDELRSAKS
ncbi:MAG: tyrosine-type recombinase/integrase [Desulfovibrio sp.]|uniref:tyrosine-type recombinase/integrase n=1 Tax=Desulfovibrio sp. TaxID=885 RepID=UPI001A7A8724|nr:integrase arm-type DNA-binding domain-containing protein [Desulfovibrio sp.]MBD5416841.1 tyrosine-type recombinase/integrase [Desulfovibrio sp.]